MSFTLTSPASGRSSGASDGGIEKNIEECVKVLQAVKTRCEAEGVKISIENHAGDMRSDELKMLIEAAGKGHVGANIDPGNAVWAMEDPLQHLVVLMMPATAASLHLAAAVFRMARSSVLDILGQDFVRALRAKGLGPRRKRRCHQ